MLAPPNMRLVSAFSHSAMNLVDMMAQYSVDAEKSKENNNRLHWLKSSPNIILLISQIIWYVNMLSSTAVKYHGGKFLSRANPMISPFTHAV